MVVLVLYYVSSIMMTTNQYSSNNNNNNNNNNIPPDDIIYEDVDSTVGMYLFPSLNHISEKSATRRRLINEGKGGEGPHPRLLPIGQHSEQRQQHGIKLAYNNDDYILSNGIIIHNTK